MVALSQIAAFIAESWNLFGTGLWFILQLSSYVGRHLVDQIVYVLGHLNQLMQLTIAFLGVIIEDFLVFYRDIIEKSTWVASLVVNGTSHFVDGVTHLSLNAVQFATKTINFLCESANRFNSGLFSLASLGKTCLTFAGEGIVLVGSSIWLAVTKTPMGILNCFIWILLQLRNFLHGILSFFLVINDAFISNVKDCLMYLYNVPHTSFLGLLIGLILFYSSVKNYRCVLIVIFKISKKLYGFMSSLCKILWKGHFAEARQEGNLNSVGAEDKLCIVCQDRLKEVITLPCRHVCLCIQCSLYIAKNHRICPICRSEIQTTMKVYI